MKWVSTLSLLCLGSLQASEPLTREAAEKALHKAVTFFTTKVSTDGGYVWRYSGDLKLREGEGIPVAGQHWVQPPGTPAVGEAFLNAYLATGDKFYRKAAIKVGHALARGQQVSGGWTYYFHLDPEQRKKYQYLVDAKEFRKTGKKTIGGWDEWRKRRKKNNMTTLDDDTTQAATRFLMRLDQVLKGSDELILSSVSISLKTLLLAQYPNGGWSTWWSRPLFHKPDEKYYPVKKASYPETWSRTWTKAFSGCYVINDDLIPDMIDTMLMAWDIYRDEKYLSSARLAGQFLIDAQMPEPQPAWAQQYDRHMQPVWSRAFEPPAITAGESESVMQALITLYRRTGDKKYLKPIPKALAYLKKSKRDDGKLSRFYELKTNRQLYFYRNSKGYTITYKDNRLPSHYGFIRDSWIEEVEDQYQRALKAKPGEPKRSKPRLTASVERKARKAIADMDDRGAWVIQDRMRGHKKTPESGVIECSIFIDNVKSLCRFLEAKRSQD